MSSLKNEKSQGMRAHQTRHLQPDLPELLCGSGRQNPSQQNARLCNVGDDQQRAGSSGPRENFGWGGADSAAVIRFEVPGTPVGKGRPRFARRGNFVSTYTPEKTASFENLVKFYANQAMSGKKCIECQVEMQINIFMSVPASWSKKKAADALSGIIRPTVKPDADNVAKSISDAINEIVFKDDKQIVELQVRKFYAERARSEVSIRMIL